MFLGSFSLTAWSTAKFFGLLMYWKKDQKKYKLGLVEIKWNYVFVKHKYRCNWTQTQIRTGLELPTTAGLGLPTGLPRLELYSNSEQGVSWHSGNYRVYIHSETRTWHDKNIQTNIDFGPSFYMIWNEKKQQKTAVWVWFSFGEIPDTLLRSLTDIADTQTLFITDPKLL